MPPDTLPLPRILYKHCPYQPGDGGPAPDTWVLNFGHFLMSKEVVDLYADRFIREYIR